MQGSSHARSSESSQSNAVSARILDTPGARGETASHDLACETLEVEVKQTGGGGEGSGEGGNQSDPTRQTPKEFLAEKAPTTDAERITVMAYYLTKVRKVDNFKTKELTDLNTEAAGHKFSNAANTAKNAISQNGYLTQATGGNRQITALGEKVVEAMPDREAVAAVIAKAPKRRKRSGGKRAKTKAKSQR
jgi:hypothetical protein